MHKTRSFLLAGLFLLGVATAALPSRAEGPRPKKTNSAPDNPKLAADALGYGAAFEAQVKKIGQITPDDFARRYPGKANYLDKLSWDPTTASSSTNS